MNGGLSELDSIDGLCRRHNGNQLRCHLFGGSGCGLPALFPPVRIIPLSVCIPASGQVRLLWIGHHRDEPTQVTDQSHL